MTLLKPSVVVALLGGLTVLIGSCGTWVDFAGVNKNGMDGDGPITLILALAGLLTAALSLGPRALATVPRCFPLPVGVLTAIVAVIDIVDVESHSSDFAGTGLEPTVAWGLWAVLVGAIVLSAGGLLMLIARLPSDDAPAVAPPPPAAPTPPPPSPPH